MVSGSADGQEVFYQDLFSGICIPHRCPPAYSQWQGNGPGSRSSVFIRAAMTSTDEVGSVCRGCRWHSGTISRSLNRWCRSGFDDGIIFIGQDDISLVKKFNDKVVNPLTLPDIEDKDTFQARAAGWRVPFRRRYIFLRTWRTGEGFSGVPACP